MARAYVDLDRHRSGLVGRARSLLFDASDLVAFGTGWLEARHGPGGSDAGTA